ncbi:MAG: hypothetical protein A2148_12580 [Chloroflexi bacterium RBG_16_68_14]|nr:MAG: hypothetical protein A2148_12580 [Chloroflexi bacterium RBG_16_68_14]
MTWVYLDGVFVDAGQARVAAGDAGLLYGRGLFETFRARRGRVYLLERHLARLEAGAGTLGIELPAALGGLWDIVRELAERCGLDDARVRLTLTAGPSTLRLRSVQAGLRTSPEGGRPTLLLQARPATDYPERMYQQGASAIIVPVRRNETSPLSRVKSLNYLDNLLAREQARSAGADEALFLNTQGRLADGSASNVFLVKGGELLTPPVEDGALPGVTRGALLELAKGAGLGSREATLVSDDLLGADEAFLTNAVAGVLPLVSVDGVPVSSGAPGEATRRLRALYEAAAQG